MADKKDDDDKSGKRSSRTNAGGAVAGVRTRVAQLVWLLFLIAALFLAVGALCIALDFNRDNALVDFVLSGADALDLGIFARDGGIKEFTEGSKDSLQTKNALFNWGIGAIVYLIVGRIVDRVIRP